jgi:predicted NBD/HSP70 family sugar kinase
MERTIGVLAAEHIAAGLVEENQLIGGMRIYPERDMRADPLEEMPADAIGERIRLLIELARKDHEIAAVGVGFPGIIRDGVVEESPNLPQMKGQRLGAALSSALQAEGIKAPVHVLNDADAMAAGVAATRGMLDRVIRVWWLGNGIGFGRYPQTAGVWEGGHMVVTLDPKEQFCRCGGAGHLEGIMGERAMRLRFLDLEPDEVFADAAEGDVRCAAFVKLWHRSLAAATATSIHLDGPGKFFISGPNAHHIQTGLLDLYLHDMVKMSPLQGSSFELLPTSDEIAVIGAAVSAAQVRNSP